MPSRRDVHRIVTSARTGRASLLDWDSRRRQLRQPADIDAPGSTSPLYGQIRPANVSWEYARGLCRRLLEAADDAATDRRDDGRQA